MIIRTPVWSASFALTFWSSVGVLSKWCSHLLLSEAADIWRLQQASARVEPCTMFFVGVSISLVGQRYSRLCFTLASCLFLPSGSCPLDLVLWILFSGSCSLDLVLWILFSGSCSLDLVIWILLCGVSYKLHRSVRRASILHRGASLPLVFSLSQSSLCAA